MITTCSTICSSLSSRTSTTGVRTTRCLSGSILLNTDDPCFDVGACTAVKEHGYVGPVFPRDARAPCPGLNTLANHGYIPRSGRDIDFITLVTAIMEVYNISLPLALLLSVPGFLLYAHLRVSWSGTRPSATYTLTLSSLSSFGPGLKIAHRASLVHPNYPTQCPDKRMVDDVVGSMRESGLTLSDLAGLRVSRESGLCGMQKLSGVHEQVALGESALTWLIFARKGEGIPVKYFKQWFGEERIPDGWTRPEKTIGLFDARKAAGVVQQEMYRLQ
ncbi:hypothetical protein EV368DRAFT_43173 [Lentinula lateritia]|nr:hypothetical protein EV368DRAFT_43173 [Lentinula lateritia]